MKWTILSVFFLFPLLINAQSEDLDKLIGSLLQETPLEEDLLELCDEIGGRVTGSEANERAVEWAYDKFQKAGISVKKDPFEMPVLWLEKGVQAAVSGEASFVPQVVSKYQTAQGKHEGRLISVGTGTAEEFATKADEIKGNYIIVETDLCYDINGLFAEYTHATKVEIEAENFGAKGIIFMSSRPKALLYRFITSKTSDAHSPQFIMAREDAKRCMRLLEAGKSLNIAVDVDAEIGGSFTAHNVIAEIPGSEFPDEVVIIGAHLDSWALGTGANDNGCNVSLMIDIARQMKASGIQPKRTIRFALWNGEEQGYFGSWDYTKDEEKNLDKHIMALSVDIGSGALTGFFTNGREELVPVVDEILKPIQSLGDFIQVNAPIVGTDNFDFMLQGVANLVGAHKPQVYGQNYHARSDTYDKVDLETLKVNSAIVGTLALGFANLSPEEVTWEQQSRTEIQKIFDEFDLEFTMRMFNVWEPWVAGERGKQK